MLISSVCFPLHSHPSFPNFDSHREKHQDPKRNSLLSSPLDPAELRLYLESVDLLPSVLEDVELGDQLVERNGDVGSLLESYVVSVSNVDGTRGLLLVSDDWKIEKKARRKVRRGGRRERKEEGEEGGKRRTENEVDLRDLGRERNEIEVVRMRPSSTRDKKGGN